MTETFAPPQPPGVHDVTTQLHGDGCYYATCTCAWHSPASHMERDALLWAGSHRHDVTPRKKSKVGWVILALVAAFFVFAAVAVGGDSADPASDSPPKAGIYARGGWTAMKAGGLSADLQLDGGMSDARADCTMRAVVGTYTWLEWSSYSPAGQLVLIDAAAGSC